MQMLHSDILLYQINNGQPVLPWRLKRGFPMHPTFKEPLIIIIIIIMHATSTCTVNEVQ